MEDDLEYTYEDSFQEEPFSESQWYMPKEDSDYFPSIQNGMKYEKEMLLREQGICMIQTVGGRLLMPIYAMATACVLFHRFYLRHAFSDYKMQKIAPACIYIACKTDESARRPSDIAKSWLHDSDRSISERKINAFVTDLLYYELLVLEATCFDLQINHPYYELCEFIKDLDTPNNVANVALAFINDSFRLPLCIWHEPRAIAAAALIGGYNTFEVPVPDDEELYWTEFCTENEEILPEIMTSIMEVYRIGKKSSSSQKKDKSRS